MTATEELRRLLDERGVEWGETRDGSTAFSDAYGHVRWAIACGAAKSFFEIGPLTAEQAIEATLGRGECRNTYERGHFKCSECGHYTQARMVYRNGEPADPRYCPWCGRKVVD